MSALHQSWKEDQASEYHALLAADLKRRQHLLRMFSVAGGRPFDGYEQRLAELEIASKRCRQWRRRIDELAVRGTPQETTR